jgi:hypothetical protein
MKLKTDDDVETTVGSTVVPATSQCSALLAHCVPRISQSISTLLLYGEVNDDSLD